MDFRVRTLLAAYNVNILSYKWVLACLERGQLVDLEPRFMVHANEELGEYFRENLDKYGDHYTQEVDERRLKEIMEGIPEEEYLYEVVEGEKVVEEIFEEGKKRMKVVYMMPKREEVGCMGDYIRRARMRS